MGRKPNTVARRQQIVDALLLEMSTSGYERASTKTIATRAGLAPGLVHYHFKSKEEVLLALVDELIADAERRSAEAMSSADSAAAQLEAFISARVGLGPKSDSDQVRAWVSILAEAMGQAKVRAKVSKWLAGDHMRLATLFAEAGAKEPKQRAAALLAMVLGSFSMHAIDVNGVPRGYAEPQIREWLASTLWRPKKR